MLKLKNHSSDPAFNLAFEEYFTSRAAEIGDSMIFFWRNRPSVIVGRFQNSFGEVDSARAGELGVEVYRRNTGGGAVYHDLNNLNYSFIVPAGSEDYLKDAKSGEPFGLLFDIILGLLSRLGVKAEKTGRNDLLLDGRKISGAARQLTRNGLLLHGTLLFDVDLDALSRVLSVDRLKYESKGLKSVASRVCNLKSVLPDMDIAGFQKKLESALSAEEYNPSASDIAAIEELAEKKYRSWEWNWGKSPQSTMRKKERFPWGTIELHIKLENGIIEDARIYGDFFSDVGAVDSTCAGSPIDLLAGSLTGLRHQDDGVRDLLASLPLEKMFIGASAAEVIAFFME